MDIKLNPQFSKEYTLEIIKSYDFKFFYMKDIIESYKKLGVPVFPMKLSPILQCIAKEGEIYFANATQVQRLTKMREVKK